MVPLSHCSILDYDGSGCLDASEFVGGLLKAGKLVNEMLLRTRIRQVIGSAKAKDIMAVHCELRRSLKEVPRARKAVDVQSLCLRVAGKSLRWSGVLTGEWSWWKQAGDVRLKRTPAIKTRVDEA